jgi:hypothetical protein
MLFETAEGVVPISRAPAVKDPASTTRTKMLKLCILMTFWHK